MSFTIRQKPERLTPSHTENVYTISSTLSGEDSYKYIVDVWLNPYTTSKKKIARIKSRPNSEGYLIIDIQKIIQDALHPNVRVDMTSDYLNTDIMMWRGSQSYDSFFTTKPTMYESFSKSNGGSEPGETIQEGLEEQLHTSHYRIMIGEEYIDSSGTEVVNISEGVGFREEQGLSYGLGTATYPGYTYGAIRTLKYTGNYGSTANTGVAIEWVDSSETTIYDSIVTTGINYDYKTPTLPTAGDKVIVKSNYSNFQYVFVWTEVEVPGEDSGWIFLETRYADNRPYWFGQFQPKQVLTWVGTDNTKLNSFRFNSTINDYNKAGHLYNWMEWSMDSLFGNQDGKFLNIASDTYPEYRDGIGVSYRKRSIYKGEPVMCSFFNGYCGEFINDLRVLVFRYKFKDQSTGSYNTDLEYIIKDHGAGPLTTVSGTYPAEESTDNQPVGNRLLHFTKNDIWLQAESQGGLEWFELNTWNYDTDPSTAWSYEETASEILRYEVKDVNCFDSPVYFVFLNSYGGWDSFTFGGKSVKTYNMDREEYSKSTYKGSSLYSRQSWDNKKEVFKNDIVVGLTAETEYLQEYDSRIVEDLIRSNFVYIIENAKLDEVENIPTLVPVSVKTSSVEEYDRNYKKLFQHTISVELNNITGYNSSL